MIKEKLQNQQRENQPRKEMVVPEPRNDGNSRTNKENEWDDNSRTYKEIVILDPTKKMDGNGFPEPTKKGRTNQWMMVMLEPTKKKG